MLRLIRRNEIPAIWGALVAALAPALVRERRSSWAVLDALMSGAWEAWAINCDDAIGFVVTSTGYVGDTDIKACWIVFAGGAIAGGPKRRTDIGRLFLAEFERLACKAGCQEMRLETRAAWRHVLVDYEVTGQSGIYTHYRKVLA